MKMEKSKLLCGLGYQKIFFLITAFTSFSWLVLVLIDYDPFTFLFYDKFHDFLADFTNVVWYSVDLDPYRSTFNSYGDHCGTGLNFIFYFLFSRFLDKTAEPSHLAWQQPALMCAILLYFMGTGSCVFLSLYEMKQGSKPVKFFTVFFLLFSAIFMYTVERGSNVTFGFLLSLFFIMNYDNENKIIRELSFILLAIAAGIRMIPALLGAVLLFEKRYKEAARLCLYGLVFFIVPFLFLQPRGGGLQIFKLFLGSMKANKELYDGSNTYSCGLNSMLAPYIKLDGLYSQMERFASYVMSAVIFLSYPFQKSKWKKLMGLVLIMTMLPEHSCKYNLIYLLPVIVLFLDEKVHRPVDAVYFILFLSLLCPLNLGFNRSNAYFLPGGIMFILYFAESAVLLINKFRKRKSRDNDGMGKQEEGCPAQ